MEMKMFSLFVILWVCLGMTHAQGQTTKTQNDRVNPRLPTVERTKFTCTLAERIPYNRNMLWCASFQMAWDAAAAQLGGPIELEPSAIVTDALNKNSFERTWIDAASVTIETGTAKNVLTKIEATLTKKNEPVGKILETIKNSSTDKDLVFFAKLSKKLEFEYPFKNLGASDYEKRMVPMFGFHPEQKEIELLLKQVLVHHYRSENDFIIELLSKTTDDQLLLARFPNDPESLANISQSVIRNLQTKAPTATASDALAVPNIMIEKTTRFPQIEGHRIVGKDLLVTLAMQSIDFQLDETGAKIHSEAVVVMGFGADDKPKPRSMIVEPPFALIMKRKQAPQAFFVVWFANADLLGTSQTSP